MTSKRNFGPVLALTGAGIAIAAVIAGFVLVGGPGDARDRRLDDLTMSWITQGLQLAHCVYNATGKAPATIEEAHSMRAVPANPIDPPRFCGRGEPPLNSRLHTGDQPAAPGDATYRAINSNRVRLCGNFRRPFLPERDGNEGYSPYQLSYPQLGQPRPAGIHCFDIELIRGADLATAPSHQGHMDVFE